MKFIALVKKIIISVLIIVFFLFAITMTVLLLNYNDYGVTQFDNTSLILIKEEISSDHYKKGDLVIVEGKRINKINLGDEIFVYQVDNKQVSIDLGIVGNIDFAEGTVSFENGDTYSIDFMIGIASKVHNKLGTYLAIIESQWGFLFLVLVPSFLIFIYQLYSLIVEIKYGPEEDEEI